VLVIDDTGDRKKGHHTDYVKRQYIGNLGKIEWDCCCYCLWSHREHYGSFALRGLQTKERLKPADIYRSKPEIAAGMIRELKAMGFRFKLVLADSLYGESGCGFINVLYELKLCRGDSQQSRGLVAA